MKKLVSLILASLTALTLVFTAVSCGKNSDDLKKISEAGVIKIGMECNYKPFNWTQSDSSDGAVAISNVAGKYANGYDVMIAKKVAERLNVKLEIVMLEWDALLASLDSGLIDGVIAGMSPTETRKISNDFSEAYYSSNLVVICRQGTPIASSSSLADLDKAEYTIAAQLGTVHYNALASQTKNVKKQMVQDFSLMQAQLDSRLIDGYVAELPTAMVYCYESSEYTYIDLKNNENGFTVTADDVAVAIGLRKGSNLLTDINAALSAISQEDRDRMMNDAVELQSRA